METCFNLNNSGLETRSSKPDYNIHSKGPYIADMRH